MSVDWGQVAVTALATNVVTGAGWLIHTFWLGPWAEKRKVVAKEKREHDLDSWPCRECNGTYPRWFVHLSTPGAPYADHVEAYCFNCTEKDNLPPRDPHPYEDYAMYSKATKWRLKS
jgi:hypothetical protein